VKEGESLDDMNNRLEYYQVEIALEKIRGLSYEENTKIMTVLNRLSNKSKGFFVETLVVRARDLLSSGKITLTMLAKIFELLDPNIVWYPNNAVIIHLFALRANQELKGGQLYTKVGITANSKEELRIFSIAEGIWRNSRYTEDNFYIKPLNDHAVYKFNMQIASATHYGKSTIVKGMHIFKLQDQEHIISTRDILTLSGKENQKAQASAGGVEAMSYGADTLLWYLYSVNVNICVAIHVYEERINANGMIEKPITLHPLMKDLNGIIPFEGEMYSLNPNLPPVGNYNLTSADKVRSKFLYRYTHAYPEILEWLFRKEIAEMDREELTPSNKLFFPIVKISKPYKPTLPRRPEYISILDILPWNSTDYGGKPELYVKTVGTVFYNPTSQQYSVDRTTGMIFKSLDMLYDRLVRDVGLDEDTRVFQHKFMEGKMLAIGTRFATVYGVGLTIHDTVILVFILFKLAGSIGY
jgi:hypothetical protein